jgi:hypothetical protein
MIIELHDYDKKIRYGRFNTPAGTDEHHDKQIQSMRKLQCFYTQYNVTAVK